jgi:hypothetical protein
VGSPMSMEHEEDISGGDLGDTKQCHASEQGTEPTDVLFPMGSHGIYHPAGPSNIASIATDFSYTVEPSDAQRSSKKTRLPVDPRPFDVLLGRGKGRLRHPGNVRMGNIVDQYRSRYFAQTSKCDKTSVIQEIVAAIQSCEGGVRFLKELPGRREWAEVEEPVAHSRVSQYLRYRHGSGGGQESNGIPPAWNCQPTKHQNVRAHNDKQIHAPSARALDVPNVVDGFTSLEAYHPASSSNMTPLPLLRPGATESRMITTAAMPSPTALPASSIWTENTQFVAGQQDSSSIPAGRWLTQDQQLSWLPQQPLFPLAPAQDFSWPHQPRPLVEIAVAAREDEADAVPSFAVSQLTRSSTKDSEESFITDFDQLFDDGD